MLNKELARPEVVSFVNSVRDELAGFDNRLEHIFDKLAELAPSFAKQLEETFDDHATSIVALFSPLESLGNKSVMQIAHECERDPVEIILTGEVKGCQ